MNGGRGPALLAIVAFLTLSPARAGADSTPERLVRQLKDRGIRNERLLDAFGRVPREDYVPAAARARAYDDVPLDIGQGQTTSQPSVIALMTDQLDLGGDERVLEIGTGSGYHTAILASLARDVYSVEVVPELASAARLRLTREGFRNVHVKQGDGTLGWREYGPYDAIVVTAAAPSVPRALIDQLVEGGVLVMPLGERDGRQVLVRGVKRGTKLRTREIGEVKFVPLLGGGRPSAARAAEPPRRPPARDDDAVAPPARMPSRDEDAPPPRRAPRPDDDDVRAPRVDPDDDEDRPAQRDDERRGPAPDLNEEELPEQHDLGPDSDIRPLRGERSRAARAPGVPRSDRRGAAGAAPSADAGSPSAVRPRAA